MEGRWRRKPGSADLSTAVVFIHGFLSNSETCWLHENGTCWPDLLATETEFSGLGIYDFTYHTDLFSGSYSLGDVVDAFKERLALDGVTAANRIVFVAHSMGGIVVRRYIVQQLGELAHRSTQVGLFLVASPSLGARYANWLKPLARFFGHSQAKALAFCSSNTWLNDLNTDFRNALDRHDVIIAGKELIEDRFIVFRRLWLFPQVVPAFTGAAFFGEALKIARSDHFSIAKPDGASAMQHRLLCRFLANFASANQQNGRLVESDGSIRAQIAGHEICVVFGSIDSLPLDGVEVVVLPCNEYFDNLCAGDMRSALGSFVQSRFPGRSDEFATLIADQCRRTLGEGNLLQKTAVETAQSFGVGSALLLPRPFGSEHSVALVATTTQRAGRGLSSRVAYLIEGMHNLFALLADARLSRIAMPLMGAGHGGINPPLALVGLLLALAEASKSGIERQRPKTITLVIYKPNNEARPSVTREEVRAALTLVSNAA